MLDMFIANSFEPQALYGRETGNYYARATSAKAFHSWLAGI